jgi:hypothetical protein
MKINNKVIAGIFICGVAAALGFMVLCGLEDGRIVEINAPSESTGELTVVPGSVYVEDGAVIFKNWYAFVPDEYISTFDINVVLKDRETGECLEIPTILAISEDIYDLYDREDLRLELSGFNAVVPGDKIGLDETSYDILLYYNSNDDDIYYYTGYELQQGGVLYEE